LFVVIMQKNCPPTPLHQRVFVRPSSSIHLKRPSVIINKLAVNYLALSLGVTFSFIKPPFLLQFLEISTLSQL